jgi:hypothetical protein
MLGRFIPLIVVATSPPERRSRLLEAMVGHIIPVPDAQRPGVGAVVADQQVRSADRRQEQAVTDTASAVESIAVKPAGARKLTDQELTNFPTLKGIVDREDAGPTIRGHLDSVANTFDAGERALAIEAANLIEKGMEQPKGDKVPEEEFKGSRIGALILASPALYAKVVRPPKFTSVGSAVPAGGQPAAGGGTPPP